MKKIYLSILSLIVAAGAMAQTAVTFNVNMGIVGPSDSLHVVGNFADPNYDNVIENPDYQNWTPNAASGLMTDGNMDFVYTITMMLEPGLYTFKFVNGNDWPGSESVPEACGSPDGFGGYNRNILVSDQPSSYNVCFGNCADCEQYVVGFSVDMSPFDENENGTLEPGVEVHPDGVFVNYNQSMFLPMQDWDGDMIWEGLYISNSVETINYIFVNGPSFDFPYESFSGACLNAGGTRTYTISENTVALPVNCWNSCDPCTLPVDVTFQVDMNASCADTSPGVNLMGTLTSWSDGAPMSDDDGDGIWTLTLSLAPGNYLYKFRVGTNGWEGIADRPLTVVADTPTDLPAVCFDSAEPCGPVVAPADVTFEVRPGALQLASGQVMWVMGNFTQPNWQEGALQMTDTDGDGTWSVTVPQVCISSIFYKFRAGTPAGADFTEETADFSEIGGCGVDNGTFSDNRQLVRADGNPVAVCWTFDLCESCAPASVAENAVASNIRVFPVPAEDQLNVQFDAPVAQRMTIRMVNSLGQAVVEENLGVVFGQKTISLNTSVLCAGVYALTLNNGSQTQVVNVMIK